MNLRAIGEGGGGVVRVRRGSVKNWWKSGDVDVLKGVPCALAAGSGRVLDKSTRVHVQVLEKMTSTSTSTSSGFSKVLEYKYKYFEKYLSTSTEYFCCKLQLIT